MTEKSFDYTSDDAQAMPVTPVAPADFDVERYADFAAASDERYARFAGQREGGVAVWQRVRVAEVFRDGCIDMERSLRWQLGGLNKTMAYLTDAPTYLEPWYGIGVAASAFGGEYMWPEGQAPVTRRQYHSLSEVPELEPLPLDSVPTLQHIRRMIEYFLEATHGRIPISWTDTQNPLNVAGELLDTSALFLGFVEDPDKLQRMLAAITDVIIRFTRIQSDLIGDALARPGHGFASSRSGSGIGMSTDNLVMISPRSYQRICVPFDTRLGEAFGGAAIHSCGNWARWLEAVKKNPNLMMVDAAFSPQTDPSPNEPEAFRDAFAHTGVIVHARIVGDAEEVLARVKRLWAPGLRLIVVTYVEDPAEQHRLYRDIHALSS